MNFGDVITLISAAHSLDGIGNDIAVETPKEVFAAVQSVSQTEALRARQADLFPSLKVLVRTCDYSGETITEVDGVRLLVYRTYRVGDITELYLERRAGT